MTDFERELIKVMKNINKNIKKQNSILNGFMGIYTVTNFTKDVEKDIDIILKTTNKAVKEIGKDEE